MNAQNKPGGKKQLIDLTNEDNIYNEVFSDENEYLADGFEDSEDEEFVVDNDHLSFDDDDNERDAFDDIESNDDEDEEFGKRPGRNAGRGLGKKRQGRPETRGQSIV